MHAPHSRRPHGSAVPVGGARVILPVVLLSLAAAPPLASQTPPVEVWSAVSAAPVVRQVADVWGAERGVEVRVRADATSRIVPQLERGAPADILVTADRGWLDRAVGVGLVDPAAARRVALNRLVLFERGVPEPAAAVPVAGHPASLRRLLEERFAAAPPGPALALAGPDVPLGRRSREALALGEVEDAREVSLGSARAVISSVLLGELPLGIGYLTDVLAEPELRAVALLGASLHSVPEVWVAPLGPSPDPVVTEFVEALAGPDGRRVFEDRGFEVPLPANGTLPPLRGAEIAASTPSLLEVVGRSVAVGILAVLLCTLPAIALGRWLARSRSRLRAPVGTALLLPLVLPPVVTGFVLLALLGSGGPLGGVLGALGIRLSFTFWAAVIAAAVVGFPLYVVVARNAFEAVDPRYEELASTLGSRPPRTLRRIVLPLALPGIAAGAVLALARGLGEFGATIVVAGNIEGETQTIALAVYQLLESPTGRERIWLYVVASVLIAALALATWEWLTGRQRARLLDGGRR